MFGAWGEPDHDTSIGIIHRALDAGINFIDTADVYSQGESETIVGKALAGGRRDDVVLATKFHGQMGVPVERRWAPAATRTDAATRGAGSCRRSRTACAGCRPTGSTSTRCTGPTRTPTSRRRSSALTDLQRQGKIRAFGSLDLPGPRGRRGAVDRASVAGWAGSSPSSRRTRCWSAGIEADLLPVAQKYGMGVLPWSPLAGGWLTGRYRKGQERADRRSAPSGCRRATTCPTPANQRKLDAADALGAAGRGRRPVADPPGAGVRAGSTRR